MSALPGISRWLARHSFALRPSIPVGHESVRSFTASAPSRRAPDDDAPRANEAASFAEVSGMVTDAAVSQASPLRHCE